MFWISVSFTVAAIGGWCDEFLVNRFYSIEEWRNLSGEYTVRLGSLHSIHTQNRLFHEEYVSFMFSFNSFIQFRQRKKLMISWMLIEFRCVCPTNNNTLCIKVDDDLSVSAYVYRCRPAPLTNNTDTDSSWEENRPRIALNFI